MKSLYAKSVAAAKRYLPWKRPPLNELERAIRTNDRENFRVGWMMGYRAGLRARRGGEHVG